MLSYLTNFAYSHPIKYYIGGLMITSFFMPTSSIVSTATLPNVTLHTLAFPMVEMLFTELTIWRMFPQTSKHLEVLPVSAAWALYSRGAMFNGLHYRAIISSFLVHSTTRMITLRYGIVGCISWASGLCLTLYTFYNYVF